MQVLAAICLTDQELNELTDTKLTGLQIAWLKEHGWRYELSRLGKPKVARAYFDKRMGIMESSIDIQFKTEPNWTR